MPRINITEENCTRAITKQMLIEDRRLGKQFYLAGYLFDPVQDRCSCEVCSTLDHCVFSFGNPDIDKYLDMLPKDCRICLIGLTKDSLKEYKITPRKIKNGDELLSKIVSTHQKILNTTELAGVYFQFECTRKEFLLQRIKEYRQQVQLLKAAGVKPRNNVFQFIKYRKRHKCQVCTALENRYIYADNPDLDKIVSLLTDDCPIKIDKYTTTEAKDLREQINHDLLKLKELL